MTEPRPTTRAEALDKIAQRRRTALRELVALLNEAIEGWSGAHPLTFAVPEDLACAVYDVGNGYRSGGWNVQITPGEVVLIVLS